MEVNPRLSRSSSVSSASRDRLLRSVFSVVLLQVIIAAFVFGLVGPDYMDLWSGQTFRACEEYCEARSACDTDLRNRPSILQPINAFSSLFYSMAGMYVAHFTPYSASSDVILGSWMVTFSSSWILAPGSFSFHSALSAETELWDIGGLVTVALSIVYLTAVSLYPPEGIISTTSSSSSSSSLSQEESRRNSIQVRPRAPFSSQAILRAGLFFASTAVFAVLRHMIVTSRVFLAIVALTIISLIVASPHGSIPASSRKYLYYALASAVIGGVFLTFGPSEVFCSGFGPWGHAAWHAGTAGAIAFFSQYALNFTPQSPKTSVQGSGGDEKAVVGDEEEEVLSMGQSPPPSVRGSIATVDM